MRRLAPLAFLSPRIIAVIVDGTAPNLTVTGLAKALPYSWIEQERGLTVVGSGRRQWMVIVADGQNYGRFL